MTIVRGSTSIYPPPKPACDRCRRTDHLISGDGPTVCFPCVELLTGAALDPMSITSQLRDVLAELHGDIVRLGEADHGTVAWEWLGWT
jgi:hypothetical protein